MNPLSRVLALAFVTTLFGCGGRVADFTVVSTQLTRLETVDTARQFQNPGKIETISFRHWMFFFPLGGKPTLKDAIDKLLKQGNGDVVVDAVVYDYGWWIPFIYGRSGWRVEGRVLNTHMRYGN
jgi:hypothetical protein